MKKPYVAYIRVSTPRQGQSGLGLEAQQETIAQEVKKSVVLAEFREIETGTRKRRRTEIYKAIDLCKQEGAILILAKLDRLARDVEFVMAVMNADIEVFFCDFPSANKFTIAIMAAVAEYEATRISTTTSASLQAKKRRGEPMGSPNIKNLQPLATAAATKVRLELQTPNKKVSGYIRSLKANGKTYKEIADILNKENYRTTRSKRFSPKNVEVISKRKTQTPTDGN